MSGCPPPLTLFLARDVMLGRRVDQLFSVPSEPTLPESRVRDARDYVALARGANRPIPAPRRYHAVEWKSGFRGAPSIHLVSVEGQTYYLSHRLWGEAYEGRELVRLLGRDSVAAVRVVEGDSPLLHGFPVCTPAPGPLHVGVSATGGRPTGRPDSPMLRGRASVRGPRSVSP